MSSSSEQLERQAEQCRSQIAETLAGLRDRMRPGEIVDQMVDYARQSGGSQFLRNLQRQAVENPLPLTLVGAGLAWLMMGSRANGRYANGSGLVQRANEAAEAAQEAGQSMYDRAAATAQEAGQSMYDRAADRSLDVQDAAGGFAETARRRAGEWSDTARAAGASAYGQAQSAYGQVESATARLREATTSTSGSVRDATASAYGSAADAANRAAQGLRSATASLGSSAAEASQSITGALKTQPLALAAIGLAIGAAFGAAFPSSEAEDRLMGDASSDMKEGAEEMASEQLEKAKAVAGQAYEDAKQGARQEAEHQGLGSAAEERRTEARGDAEGEGAQVETESPALVPSNDESARQNDVQAPAVHVDRE